jgi:hypothetical protein
MFVGGICSIIFPFFRHMGINIAYSVIFAVFPGVIQIATPMLIVSIVGFKALSTAYPLSHMIINFVMLIGCTFTDLEYLMEFDDSICLCMDTSSVYFRSKIIFYFVHFLL